jgi:acetyl-CoA carboxylase biotin carboxyl carrier protein
MEFKQIQTIIKDFEKSNIRELELVMEGITLKLSKNEREKTSVQTVEKKDNTVMVEEVVAPTVNGEIVKAPLVGTFYAASSPDATAFSRVGDKVSKGDVLFIIEAMKIMNEITAPVSGTIEEIFVKDGDAVGFEQKILRIV